MGSLWVFADTRACVNTEIPTGWRAMRGTAPGAHRLGSSSSQWPTCTVPAITQGAQVRSQKGLTSLLSLDSFPVKLKNKPQKGCPKSQMQCLAEQNPTKTMSAFNQNLPDSTSRNGPQTRRNTSQQKDPELTTRTDLVGKVVKW